MILTPISDINKMLKLTQGQCHKVKDQGQICNFVKKQNKNNFFYEDGGLNVSVMLTSLSRKDHGYNVFFLLCPKIIISDFSETHLFL